MNTSAFIAPRVEQEPYFTSSPYEPSLPPVTLVDEIDLTDPDLYHKGDPHAAWRLLREQAPVFWHEKGLIGTEGKGFWVISRYEDIVPVYQDSTLFSSENGPFLDVLLEDMPKRMLPCLDGSEHQVRKLLVRRFFTRASVEVFGESLRKTITRLLDSVADKHECDFNKDLAQRFPIEATCEFLGIAQEDAEILAKMLHNSTKVEDVHAFNEATLDVFTKMIEKCQESKKIETIVDQVANAEIEGEIISNEDRLHLLWNVFFGGIDSTAHAANGGLMALFHHPDQLQLLKEDPTLANQCAEEILRWTSTSHANKRLVKQDVKIRDTLIKKGDYVTVWTPSGNRDEEAFDEPYRFNLLRKFKKPIVTFGGGGPHQCLGQQFARLELRIFFEEFFKRFPNVELAGPGKRGRVYTMQISPMESIPIKF